MLEESKIIYYKCATTYLHRYRTVSYLLRVQRCLSAAANMMLGKDIGGCRGMLWDTFCQCGWWRRRWWSFMYVYDDAVCLPILGTCDRFTFYKNDGIAAAVVMYCKSGSMSKQSIFRIVYGLKYYIGLGTIRHLLITYSLMMWIFHKTFTSYISIFLELEFRVFKQINSDLFGSL